MKRTISIRSDPNFKRMLDDIKTTRVRLGKNKVGELSDRRLTKAITNIVGIRGILTTENINNDK